MKGGFFTGRGKAKIIFVIETGMAKHTSIVFLKLDLHVTLRAITPTINQNERKNETIDPCETIDLYER